MARYSISSELCSAIGAASNADRVEALRKLARSLSDPLPRQPHSSALCGDVIATLHQQTLAKIYESLRINFRDGPIDEVDVAIFATDGKRDHVICALSRLMGLPAERVELAFSGESTDLLLVICRTHNFAWSSVRALLELHHTRINPAVLEELHAEYHLMPLEAARRFGRFLHVHMNQPS